MADTKNITFNWPHAHPQSVIVTGTFDNWSSSVHLQRTESGFSGSVAVPWDTKILYKFIVDGNWVTHPTQPTETDGSGFVNNVVHTPTKPAPVPQPAETAAKEAEPGVATAEETKEEVVDGEQPKKIEGPVEVAPDKEVTIQPVLDSATDTTPEAKPVTSEPETSTHEAGVQESGRAPAPASAPVTPIKTNGTTGHARTSTGTSTAPSSSAPSTPKTQTTFPAIEGETVVPTTGSPDSKTSSRKKRLSLIDRVKSVLGSPKGKGKKREGRSASPSPKKSGK